jgi:hypothetical protein
MTHDQIRLIKEDMTDRMSDEDWTTRMQTLMPVLVKNQNLLWHLVRERAVAITQRHAVGGYHPFEAYEGLIRGLGLELAPPP